MVRPTQPVLARALGPRPRAPANPTPYRLVAPRRPLISAAILYRAPKLRSKLKYNLTPAAHPRLAQLFPRTLNAKDRAQKLRRKLKDELRVVRSHFSHLTTKSLVRGRAGRQKVLPGETPKKWKKIADRIAFYNLRQEDQVRITSGPPALMWEGVAERDAGTEPSKTEVVGAEASLEPKIWTIRSIDKRNGLVTLRDLNYEVLPTMPDPRAPNQTQRVHIKIPYSRLQLRIPDKVLEAHAAELKAAGVPVADELPTHVFATRLETRNVRAPDFRVKQHMWQRDGEKRLAESSGSLAGQWRREGRVARAARVLAEAEERESGLERREGVVDKRVVVRALGAETFAEVAGEAEERDVVEIVDLSTGAVVRSEDKPDEEITFPRAFTWDRVVLATTPALAQATVTRRVKVGETDDEVRYEEREERIKLVVPFRSKTPFKLKNVEPGPLDTLPEVVASVSWCPPDIEVLHEPAPPASVRRPTAHVDALSDDYLSARADRAASGGDSLHLAAHDAGAVPIELVLARELANPYGSDRREKARLARKRAAADALAAFVSDTVGAHLVREARVAAGLEPRVGRKMPVSEVILTARRRWAEQVVDQRAEDKAAFEARQREKWGPSRSELKSARKRRQKSLLVGKLRQTTLIPGKNQVIPVGLERLPSDDQFHSSP